MRSPRKNSHRFPPSPNPHSRSVLWSATRVRLRSPRLVFIFYSRRQYLVVFSVSLSSEAQSVMTLGSEGCFFARPLRTIADIRFDEMKDLHSDAASVLRRPSSRGKPRVEIFQYFWPSCRASALNASSSAALMAKSAFTLRSNRSALVPFFEKFASRVSASAAKTLPSRSIAVLSYGSGNERAVVNPHQHPALALADAVFFVERLRMNRDRAESQQLVEQLLGVEIRRALAHQRIEDSVPLGPP